MNTLITLFLSFGLMVTPVPKANAEVVEVNDRAVVEVRVDRGYQIDAYIFDFPTRENSYEPEISDAYTGQKLNPIHVYGTFHKTWEGINYLGERETLYQFKSYDDSVWWALTENDMGFVPTMGKPYMLLFDENRDTKANHSCPAELDCDCYCYDDLFLGVYEL